MDYIEKQTEVEDDVDQWLSSGFASGLYMLWRPIQYKILLQHWNVLIFFEDHQATSICINIVLSLTGCMTFDINKKRYGMLLYIRLCFKSLFILMY